MSEMKLPRRYRYNYRRWLFAGNWNESYELVGCKGGLHFHVVDLGAEHGEKYGQRFSCGLEMHSRTPLYGDDPPSHDECWLLKCPCWHDGTSLYAQKTLLPMQQKMTMDGFFAVLAGEADEHFNREQNQ